MILICSIVFALSQLYAYTMWDFEYVRRCVCFSDVAYELSFYV